MLVTHMSSIEKHESSEEQLICIDDRKYKHHNGGGLSILACPKAISETLVYLAKSQ